MAITIRARREGFRRCGIAHSVEPTTYPDNKFGASQLDALRCEPMLIVEEPVVGEVPKAKQEKSPAAPATSPTVDPEKPDPSAGNPPALPSENSDATAGKTTKAGSEKAEAKAGKTPATPAKTTKAK